MNSAILIVINTLIQVLSAVIIIDALLSFVLPSDNSVRYALGTILNPIYTPLRRFLPPIGGLDLTPLAVLLLLQLLSNLLNRVLIG